MIHSKKGFEFTVTYLVMLILGITALIFGILFATDLFSKAQQTKLQLDEQTEKQIEQLLLDGSRVAIPLNQKEVQRNDLVSFGIGVLNVLGNQETFRVSVTPGAGYRPDKTTICSPCSLQQSWVQQAQTTVSLQNNEDYTFLVGFLVPKNAEVGTYIFNVNVESGISTPEAYGTAKIYVEVR